MTKKIHKPQALLVVTAVALVLALATTFAWFSSRFITRDFTFTTARMGSTVYLYEATDFDLDGYPDLENGKEVFVEEEKLQDTNSDKLITYLTIYNMRPSQVYTYQIKVTNNGTVKAEVLGEFGATTSNLLFLQTLAITPILINQDNTISKGTRHYLADTSYMSYDDQGSPTEFKGLTFINNEAYAPLFKDYSDDYADLDYREPNNTKDFYFQIEMVPYDELKKQYPNLALTEAQYNSLQMQAVDENSVGEEYEYAELLFLVALEAAEFQGVTAEETTSEPTTDTEPGA